MSLLPGGSSILGLYGFPRSFRCVTRSVPTTGCRDQDRGRSRRPRRAHGPGPPPGDFVRAALGPRPRLSHGRKTSSSCLGIKTDTRAGRPPGEQRQSLSSPLPGCPAVSASCPAFDTRTARRHRGRRGGRNAEGNPVFPAGGPGQGPASMRAGKRAGRGGHRLRCRTAANAQADPRHCREAREGRGRPRADGACCFASLLSPRRPAAGPAVQDCTETD